MGLTDLEFERILSLMGREPTLTELGMFAVMWSEHCAYKYSRPILAYFRKYREALEQNGFENAGVVDLGDGLLATMKIESHNHPSAIEPYQGAATGVGGIIRDILTMGARPIASLNSLRFGPIVESAMASPETVSRNRYLFERVVEGIGGYGNCVGVPTVGGELGFDVRYSGNPLVNAMAVGILKAEDLTTAAASGEGNPVLYLGSATGKDGIHGATFASETLGESDDSKRPNVQIGDPFAEKLLIEATLEALETGAILAIQDMGAAGLTCSTIEMSAKGGVGMCIDLDLVPMRELDMSAYELMLSESQERMLCVAKAGRESEVIEVFTKWGLPAVVIGTVTAGNRVHVKRHGEIAADVVARHLADECPTYTLEAEVPESYKKSGGLQLECIPCEVSKDQLYALLSTPGIGSKKWVYRQYDQQVQTQSAILPGQSGAAVLAPRGTGRGIAVAVDGNSRWVAADPYVGGQLAVCEAARNVASVGARPVAVTDGLNYGNPQNPHVYWQFKESVRGIADACEALGTPVISGNVSFYNESDLGEVPPTPLIGMMGILANARDCIVLGFPKSSGNVGIVGYATEDSMQGMGASAYLWNVRGQQDGRPARPNLEEEAALCELLVLLAQQKLLTCANDVSEGGLGVALVEMALASHVGARINLDELQRLFGSSRIDALIFGEHPGRVLIGFEPAAEQAIAHASSESGLLFAKLGTYESDYGMMILEAGTDFCWELTLDSLEESYESALAAMVFPESRAGNW